MNNFKDLMLAEAKKNAAMERYNLVGLELKLATIQHRAAAEKSNRIRYKKFRSRGDNGIELCDAMVRYVLCGREDKL